MKNDNKMNFKKFKAGVMGEVLNPDLLENNQKTKTPFSTTLFLLLVWIFYAKWVYILRERKAKNDIKR